MALAAALLAGAVAVVGSYTFLPPMLEGMMGRGIQSRLGLESEPQAELTSDPPPRMLAGEFSHGRVVMKDPVFGGMRAERVAMDLDPFRVDMLEVVRSGELRSRDPLSGELRVELPEREVERVVVAAADVPVSGMDLVQDRIVLNSEVRVLGAEVPVSVEGKLRLRGRELVFRFIRAEAFGMTVPEKVSKDFLSGARFGYPLRGLPYGAKVTKVRVEEGSVILSGRVERLVLG